MPSIQEHLDGATAFRPTGPDDEAAEGPWFVMDPAQIRRLGDIAEHHDGAIRVEYRGAGFWRAYCLDRDGEALDDGQEIHADEA
jgi:hypothetical protein